MRSADAKRVQARRALRLACLASLGRCPRMLHAAAEQQHRASACSKRAQPSATRCCEVLNIDSITAGVSKPLIYKLYMSISCPLSNNENIRIRR